MTEYEVIGIVVSGLVIIIGLFMSIFIPLLKGVLTLNNLINGLQNSVNLTDVSVTTLANTVAQHTDQLETHEKAIRDIQINCIRIHPANYMKENG